MEHISQSNAEAFKSGTVTSYEYDFPEAKMNLARIQINGRYPSDGFAANREVDSIVHVMSGEGFVETQDGTIIQLRQNDQLHLAAGDAYFFEGNFEILYGATPKWNPEQTMHITG